VRGATPVLHNKDGQTDAERRREALRRALKDAKSLASIARRAGIRSPETLGNFLRGVSDSLNVATLEPIARVLKCTVSELIGDPMFVARQVRGSVSSGKWQSAHCPEAWREIVVPELQSDLGPSYFLQLDSNEMDEVWPQGTLLKVVDLADFRGTVRPGNRVIVAAAHPCEEGMVQRACLEVRLPDADSGQCQLIWRSRDPARSAIGFAAWPWPITPDHVEIVNGIAFRVQAVVIGALVAEDVRPPSSE
jgi:transcriptional regulator with XRE-family HTH domain